MAPAVLVLRNWLADVATDGSIHHDATARALGFPSGLVPGDVHLVITAKVMVDRFGPAWFERGWYRHTFVAATYDGEEARIEVDELPPLPGDEARIDVRLVRVSDEATVGAASGGIYRDDAGDGADPWERPDRLPDREGDGYDPLPHEPLGTEWPSWLVTADADAFAGSLAAGSDDTPWYRTESPWGPPIVPLVGPFNQAHRMKAPPIPPAIGRELRSGVNARFECRWAGPLFVGTPYRRRARTVAKGASGRFAHRVVQFALSDPDDGQTPFTARWHVKWATSRPVL